MLRTITSYPRRRLAGAVVIASVVAAAFIAPALAIFPVQRTELSGPAIGSLTPQGGAQLNQAAQPKGPGTLVVQLTNLNLPGRTLLNVSIDRRPVGVLVVASGNASASLKVPFQVGRLSSLVVTLQDGTPNGTLVASGEKPWDVSGSGGD